MKAEIIAIGDELTSGQRLDTNSQWLSQQLADIGVSVLVHTTVADDLETNAAVYLQAAKRADVIISTGGLGPTADDLTRAALAAATGTDLQLNGIALQHIERLFARRRRPMAASNRDQALFPEGSRMIPNPLGTAPGIDLDLPRDDEATSRVFALPGVPSEMRDMWESYVRPALLQAGAGQQIIRHRQIHCFGVGESELERMLPDLIRRGRQPTVGITASKATITLRIAAQGVDEVACEAAMEPTIATIRDCLGELIFGEGPVELQDVLIAMLRQRGETLATVQWGSGALLAPWLVAADETSDVYRGGISLCGPRDVAEQLGKRVSDGSAGSTISGKHLASRSAAWCRERFEADYGLVIGIGDGGVASELPQPTLYCAVEGPHGEHARHFVQLGHPAIAAPREAKLALNMLRLFLLGSEG